MNIKILSLLLIPFSISCVSLKWFSKPQKPVQLPPRVVIINIYNDLDFTKCSKELINAKKQANIVGVILRINNHGGSGWDFSVIHDLIKNLATSKPVVCLVEGCALSAGYLVASSGNFIFAHSCSGIGGIGVILQIDRHYNPKVKKDGWQADLKEEIFSAGEFKGIYQVCSPELTDRQRIYLQERLMKDYQDFIKLVSQNRNLNKDDYKVWAEGKIFNPQEGLELRLIDGIGTIFDAEEKIKQLIVERDPNFKAIDDIEFV